MNNDRAISLPGFNNLGLFSRSAGNGKVTWALETRFSSTVFLWQFCSGMRRNQAFRLLSIFFFPFAYRFAAVIDHLLGLLLVQNFLRKHHRDEQFLLREWSAWNFAANFSLKFLRIFVHISSSTELITLIWASLERSFPPAELFEFRWCQFW